MSCIQHIVRDSFLKKSSLTISSFSLACLILLHLILLCLPRCCWFLFGFSIFVIFSFHYDFSLPSFGLMEKYFWVFDFISSFGFWIYLYLFAYLLKYFFEDSSMYPYHSLQINITSYCTHRRALQQYNSIYLIPHPAFILYHCCIFLVVMNPFCSVTLFALKLPLLRKLRDYG